MIVLRNITFVLFLFIQSSAYSYSLAGQTLVTVHGFLGAPWTMKYMASYYEGECGVIVNWGYSSRDKRIEEHASDLVKDLQGLAEQNPGSPIHFITHSMGGLVLRSAINHPDCPAEAKIGRAVLLAPPNQGACWGRFIEQFALVRAIGKDQSGKQLMTEQDFEHLGQFPDSMQVMVIAGSLSFNPFIEGENDGTVAVDETYLSTPHRHIVIKEGHKRIIFSKKAAKLAKSFLHEDFE